MARSDAELREIKWDIKSNEYKAEKALFPYDQFHEAGLSIYLPELIETVDMDPLCIFQNECYPDSTFPYTHVAKVPRSALGHTTEAPDPCTQIVKKAHDNCEAGKAHALIMPIGSVPRQRWVQIRDRLISFAKIIPRSDFRLTS